MLDFFVGLAIVGGAVVGPVAWMVVRDRLRERALALQAQIQAVVNQRLGGESLLAIEVRPRTPWRTGRVVLMAPSYWPSLLEDVWMPVLERLPAGYELVVSAPAGGVAAREDQPAVLSAAA
jgi:hypothetical protein